VGEVRAAWEADPARHERLFDRIGEVVAAARAALAAGDWPRLGGLLDANHALLRELGVSCDELDHLCDAARRAGALGAKLSGGGRGGNMIALARDAAHAADVRAALVQAGAKRVI
jgi:mevalonate kinase